MNRWYGADGRFKRSRRSGVGDVGLAAWLIDNVPALRREMERRERAACTVLAGKLSAMAEPSRSAAQAMDAAGITSPERRERHQARLAEAMEKDAAAKYMRTR